MAIENEITQQHFIQRGGVLEMALAKKWKSGELQRNYVYQEYPKVLTFDDGEEEIERSTETIQGRGERTITWTETRRKIREVVVHSEDEEERVLAGGKTTTQIEAERQHLIARCKSLNIRVDSSWSAVRLKRELGEKLDAPETPGNKMADLERQLADLRRMEEMQAEIDRLQARLSKPNEAEDLRQQLESLGVTVDRRWAVPRLREELDKATTPGTVA